MSYKPTLRREVSLQLREGTEDDFSIADTLLGHRVGLDRVTAALVARIDGTRTLEQLIEELVAPTRPRAGIEAAFRHLLFLNVIEGAGADVVARLRALQSDGGTLDAAVLPELRFACEGSGNCCRSFTLGPLNDADVALLESLAITQHFPHLGEGPHYYYQKLAGSDRMERFLPVENGACAFLLDDHRCGLHVRFGEASKPSFCRIYPFDQVARFDGVRVYDRGGCSRYATTSRGGAPVAQQQERLVPLRSRPLKLDHPIVELLPGVSVDYGYVQPWIDASVADVGRRFGPAPEALRAAMRRLTAIAEDLPSCALTPRGPAAVVAEVLARSPREFYAPPLPADLAAGARAIATIAGGLASAASAVASQPSGSIEPYLPPRLDELANHLGLVRELARRVEEPSAPAPPVVAKILPVTVDDPEVQEVLRGSLRQALFGRGAILHGRSSPALLRLAFVQLLTLTAARKLAQRERAAAVSPPMLSAAHSLATRMLELTALQKVFVEHRELARVALEALPAVAAVR